MWEYGFLCWYGWPSSGYGSTVSLLTCNAGWYGGYYGNLRLSVCLLVCLVVGFLAPRSVTRGGSGDYMVFLSDVWLQLGWCIISLRWWSFQTQLQIWAECACMPSKHTLNTVYIKARMYLYFRIQASSNQYFSTYILFLILLLSSDG